MSAKLSIPLFLSSLLLPNAYGSPDIDSIVIPPPYVDAGTVYMPPEPIINNLSITAKVDSPEKMGKTQTIATATTGELIANTHFNDANLETCVLNTANNSGWTLTTQVTGLKCDNLNIADVDGLQHFTSLDFLSLHGNQIVDVTPLSELNALQYLYLYDNQINDISPLGQLTDLHILYLYSNQISNITPLSGLTGLDRLYLSDNQISDISVLSNLSPLRYLLLDRNQISDLTALTNLTALKTLFLYSNQISDISALAGLSALQRLHLSGNQIADLSVLSGLTELQWLLLGGNQISDISPLAPLTRLQILDLNINNISDIGALAPLVALQVLYVGYNQLSDISPLVNLTALRTLLLQKNLISDIPVLANLTALQSVELHYNQIVNIAALHQLTNAVTINLSQNNDITCNDLNALEATLGSGIVIRPDNGSSCPDNGEGPYPGTKTGPNDNIALIGTNGLTARSYSASSTYFRDTPAGAFDGYLFNSKINQDAGDKKLRGTWLSGESNPWLQIDFGVQTRITGLANFDQPDFSERNPQDVILQVSDNGVDFVDHQALTFEPLGGSYTLTTPAQGRYFRLLTTRHADFIQIDELEYYGSFIEQPSNEPGNGTKTGSNGNIALIGTNGLTADSYSASSTYFRDSPSGAFDGYLAGTKANEDAGNIELRGLWLSSDSNPWLQIDFGVQTRITGLANFQRSGGSDRTPQDVILQVSDNGIDFVDHQALTFEPLGGSYTLTTPAQGRYFRLLTTRHADFIEIDELEYYGSFIE